MGLVQRVIEARGVATVAISQVLAIARRLQAPRSLFLRWPFGHALGEPGNVNQQRRVLWEMLRDVRTRPFEERGEVREPGLRWRRETYAPVDFQELDR